MDGWMLKALPFCAPPSSSLSPPLSRVTQHRPHPPTPPSPSPAAARRPPPRLRTPASPEPSLAELPQYCEGSALPLLSAARSPRGKS